MQETISLHAKIQFFIDFQGLRREYSTEKSQAI